MFLSRCHIEPQRLSNPYETHRLLWKQFPERSQESRPFLFQMEQLGRGGQQRGEILMLSSCQPVSAERELSLIAVKPYQPRLVTGQVLRFRLDANPVKRLNQSQNRVPLLREEDQIAWLDRKLSGAARLMECTVSAKEDLFFRKQRRAGKIVKVRFEGVLEVMQEEQMKMLIQDGIGPAKAFGCGMLLVRRA